MLSKLETRLFINGKYVAAQKGGTFENLNPATLEKIAEAVLVIANMAKGSGNKGSSAPSAPVANHGQGPAVSSGKPLQRPNSSDLWMNAVSTVPGAAH